VSRQDREQPLGLPLRPLFDYAVQAPDLHPVRDRLVVESKLEHVLARDVPAPLAGYLGNRHIDRLGRNL
jgi:hypothetical protein